MGNKIYHIYDKIFKKILTLSSTAVVRLINGLFGTDYPPDSFITYNWTEQIDSSLKRVLADTILTIGGTHSYHVEAQMEKDDDIVFRVFEYGYNHAQNDKNRRPRETEGYTLYFPEPKIIYLFTRGKAPDEYALTLDFGTQGTFIYKVSTFKYLESTPEELMQKKMVILIPFELLKLREIMKKEHTPENLELLKNLIQNDIIGNNNKNLEIRNITADDARKLRRLTHKLYDHIYSHYDELEELNEMTDESLMLDIDIIEKEHETQLARLKDEIAVLKTQLEESNKMTDESLMLDIDIIEKEHEKRLVAKDAELAVKDVELIRLKNENALLKARLEELNQMTD